VARVNFFVDAQPSDWISTRKQEECVEKICQVCEESCCYEETVEAATGEGKDVKSCSKTVERVKIRKMWGFRYFSPPAQSEIFELSGGCCDVASATTERAEYRNWTISI
jgi:hypothetical protein